MSEYSILQLDIIKELTNIGGGNAATSISQLINKPVDMEVPDIKILNYSEVYEKIMPEDEMVNGVVMRILGGAEGTFLFIIGEKASSDIVNMMIPDNVQITEELSDSAIRELVNIVATSYLNAISKMIDINFISSVPLLVKDMFAAILSSVYIDSEQYDEDIMIISNEFLYQGDRINSSLYFIPRPGVLTRLFNKIGL